MSTPTDLAAEQLKRAEEAKAAAEAAIKAAQLAAAEAAEEELLLLQKSIKARQKAFEDMVENHKAEMEALNSKVQKLQQLSSTTPPVKATPVATPAAAVEATEEEEAKASYDYRAVIALLVIVVGGLYLFFV